MTDLPLDGSVDAAFVPVGDAFAQVLADQPGTGASLAVWHGGGWVVDLWGGWADAHHTVPWRRDSIVMPYSVTKPFAAVCVLLLADRGRVDLDEPLASYWPGLDAATATVRHVLAHRAGLVVLDEDLPTEALYDHARMCRALERQRPAWEPGTAHGESALLYGYLLDELVRRVDGRTLGTFLREEVCGPLGLDFHVGLGAAELARTVELTGYDADLRHALEGYGPLMRRALDNPPGALDPGVVNSEAWRRAEIAAVNGHGTARAVAGLYVALARGELLSPALLDQLVTVHASGHDRVLGQDASWGLGVGVDDDGFGMGGVGGSFGWWSRTGEYALAFLTGRIAGHDRGDRVENAMREVLGLPAV
ncbi:MAG TPA: serine hydrolase domain-containing protein [Nocardioidaceae bacterium]